MSSEITHRGLMLVISSPSGAGKTSLSRRLVAENPDLMLSVSATTRKPRPGEADGREYRFISPAAFNSLVAKDAFLEWADVHEHRYGTPREPVEAAIAGGKDVLFDIDWQGAAAITRAKPEEVVRVFILPPSMADLARRLHARAQDDEDVIQRRLARAHGEIGHWREYDYVIVNDDFDLAYARLEHIYRAERLKRVRSPGLDAFVDELLAQTL